jgi:hypothetical protein
MFDPAVRLAVIGSPSSRSCSFANGGATVSARVSIIVFQELLDIDRPIVMPPVIFFLTQTPDSPNARGGSCPSHTARFASLHSQRWAGAW